VHVLSLYAVEFEWESDEHDAGMADRTRHLFMRDVLGDHRAVNVLGIPWGATGDFLDLDVLSDVH